MTNPDIYISPFASNTSRLSYPAGVKLREWVRAGLRYEQIKKQGEELYLWQISFQLGLRGRIDALALEVTVAQRIELEERLWAVRRQPYPLAPIAVNRIIMWAHLNFRKDSFTLQRASEEYRTLLNSLREDGVIASTAEPDTIAAMYAEAAEEAVIQTIEKAWIDLARSNTAQAEAKARGDL